MSLGYSVGAVSPSAPQAAGSFLPPTVEAPEPTTTSAAGGLHGIADALVSRWAAMTRSLSERDSTRLWTVFFQRLNGASRPSEVPDRVLLALREALAPANVEILRTTARPPASDAIEIPMRFMEHNFGRISIRFPRGRVKPGPDFFRRAEALAAAAAITLATMDSHVPAGNFNFDRRRTPCALETPVDHEIDQTTGLPDAAYLETVLSRALAKPQGAPLALMIITPRGVRELREQLGNVYAESAMRLVARATRETLRSIDPVTRLDRDHLAAALAGANESDAERVATALHLATREAGLTASTPQPLTAVIAFANAPQDATTARELLAVALRRIRDAERAEPQS